MKKTLFTFLSLFFTLMTISKGSPEYNYQGVVHGHLDDHPLKLPMIRPTPLPLACQKALLDLKCCSDQIHSIFLGKKVNHVTDKCCKSIMEFEHSCLPCGVVPQFVIPHLLKDHCVKVAMKPKPDLGPTDPDPVPTPPASVPAEVAVPPPPVPLVRSVPVLVADPPPPPDKSVPIVAAAPPPPTGSVGSVTTNPIPEALPPSPAPAPSPSDLFSWLIVK